MGSLIQDFSAIYYSLTKHEQDALLFYNGDGAPRGKLIRVGEEVVATDDALRKLQIRGITKNGVLTQFGSDFLRRTDRYKECSYPWPDVAKKKYVEEPVWGTQSAFDFAVTTLFSAASSVIKEQPLTSDMCVFVEPTYMLALDGSIMVIVSGLENHGSFLVSPYGHRLTDLPKVNYKRAFWESGDHGKEEAVDNLLCGSLLPAVEKIRNIAPNTQPRRVCIGGLTLAPNLVYRALKIMWELGVYTVSCIGAKNVRPSLITAKLIGYSGKCTVTAYIARITGKPEKTDYLLSDAPYFESSSGDLLDEI